MKQFEKLAEYCLKNGIRYGQTEEERFTTFFEFLVEKNKVMNLTAVTEPEEVELRHYIDSVSSVPVLKELFGERFFTQSQSIHLRQSVLMMICMQTS